MQLTRGSSKTTVIGVVLLAFVVWAAGIVFNYGTSSSAIASLPATATSSDMLLEVFNVGENDWEDIEITLRATADATAYTTRPIDRIPARGKMRIPLRVFVDTRMRHFNPFELQPYHVTIVATTDSERREARLFLERGPLPTLAPGLVDSVGTRDKR